jgi:hypothetical protein
MANKPFPSTPRALSRAIVALARCCDDKEAEAGTVVKALYGDNRHAFDIATRGAVVPASTSNTAALTQTSISSLVSILGPMSASAMIFNRALQIEFGRDYAVTVPALTASATGVQFTQQGAPIAVKQFSFSGVTLNPQKVCMACGFTRELFDTSNAENLIQALLIENFTLGMDAILLDQNAADGTRPAGLRNGVTPITAQTGAPPMSLVFDLANLAAAVAPIGGNDLMFVASPKQAVKIALYRTSELPFPVAASAGLADTVVMCIALNALVVAGGNDAPKFSVSRETMLHFEDTSPQPIGTPGTPNVVAAPARSLWQSDAVAVRLVADLTWSLRAPSPSAVSFVTGVAW